MGFYECIYIYIYRQKWPITINFENNLLRNTVSELYSNVPLFRAYSGVFLKIFFISPITGSRGPIVAFLSPIEIGRASCRERVCVHV